MFIVCLILGIICFIGYIKTQTRWNENNEIKDMFNSIFCYAGWVIGGIGILILMIGVIELGVGYYADKSILIYQQENEKIEEQVDEFIKLYVDYEKETLKEFKPETIEIMIMTYPQLKTNELMLKQIDVYVENNNKIKELKETQIYYEIGKWLLYFG